VPLNALQRKQLALDLIKLGGEFYTDRLTLDEALAQAEEKIDLALNKKV
jgi:hypothetical protein